MSVFESINNTSNKAADLGDDFLKKSQEYYKLKIFEQLTISVSMIGKALSIGGLLFIGLLFLAIAGAVGIGQLLNNIVLGYVIIAAIFLLFSFLLYLKRDFISKLIIQKMYPKFFNS